MTKTERENREYFNRPEIQAEIAELQKIYDRQVEILKEVEEILNG